MVCVITYRLATLARNSRLKFLQVPVLHNFRLLEVQKMEPPKKVFLCWSKNRSKVIAEGWAKLLPEIVTGKPILSTEFQKGREWSTTLRNDLNDAKTWIIFLTPENRGFWRDLYCLRRCSLA